MSAYEEFEDSEGGVLFLWLMFEEFWYHLTGVVPDKALLNGYLIRY